MSYNDPYLQFSADTTAKTFKFNHDEAKLARDFQKEMSSTSHQMEVADLKKAGLNPVLSANGGAAAYGASTASGAADSSGNGASAAVTAAQISAAAQRDTNKTNWKIAKNAQKQENYRTELGIKNSGKGWLFGDVLGVNSDRGDDAFWNGNREVTKKDMEVIKKKLEKAKNRLTGGSKPTDAKSASMRSDYFRKTSSSSSNKSNNAKEQAYKMNATTNYLSGLKNQVKKYPDAFKIMSNGISHNGWASDWSQLTSKQRNQFRKALPSNVRKFAAQYYNEWQVIDY